MGVGSFDGWDLQAVCGRFHFCTLTAYTALLLSSLSQNVGCLFSFKTSSRVDSCLKVLKQTKYLETNNLHKYLVNRGGCQPEKILVAFLTVKDL
jgi:hypothetical protein